MEELGLPLDSSAHCSVSKKQAHSLETAVKTLCSSSFGIGVESLEHFHHFRKQASQYWIELYRYHS